MRALLELRDHEASRPAPCASDTLLLSVVIPVFNERRTLLKLLEIIRTVPIDKEIIVVDDGSTDGSREMLEQQVDGKTPGVRVFYQPYNMGKGAAVRRGFQEACGEIVLVQDADLEYDPSEYPQLIEPILSGKADVVYGSRYQHRPHRVHRFWHTLGNRYLTLLSNMLTDLNLTDVATCYKTFRREVIQGLPLKENGFGFCPEVTAKVARRGWTVFEVPISYSARTHGEGKKIHWRHLLPYLWCMVRYAVRD